MKYITEIPDEIASRRWLFWISICYGLIVVVGSVVTAIVGILAIFAIILIVFDKEKFSPQKNEKILAVVILLYISVSFVFSLFKPDLMDALKYFVNNTTFLLLFALFPVIRAFSNKCWVEKLYFAVSSGLILSCSVLIFQLIAFDAIRPHAMVANPLVLATIAAGFSLLALHRTFESVGRVSYFHFLAFGSAILIILITGSRGAIIALFLSTSILLIFNWRIILTNMGTILQLTYLVLLISIIIFELLINHLSFNYILNRYDITNIFTDYTLGEWYDESIDARLEMLKGGWRAFKEAPWTGHGRQNIMQVTSDLLGIEPMRYSHLHNAFITEIASSGILGLLTFLMVCFMPIYLTWNSRRTIFNLAVSWVVCWMITVMSGIGFYHDLTICYFSLSMLFFHLLAHLEDSQKEKSNI